MTHLQNRYLAFITVFFIALPFLNGQIAQGYVLDKSTNAPLSYANISIKGTTRGTISNDEGFFQLKLTEEMSFPVSIIISYIGYSDKEVVFTDSNKKTIYLEFQSNMLPSVVVRPNFEEYLITKAWESRKNNYPFKGARHKGFLRQTVSKGDSIKYLGEAVIDYYKGSYAHIGKENQIEILKFRKFTDEQNYEDSIRLFGAPFYVYSLDFVKIKSSIIDPQQLNKYEYEYTESIYFQGSPHYKIKYKSKTSAISGYILINEKDYAISHIVFKNDNPPVAENNYLKDKYRIATTYQKTGDKYVLKKIISSLRFTNKNTKEELSVNIIYTTTESKLEKASPIPLSKNLSYNTIIMDNQRDTSATFWQQYNTIAQPQKVSRFIQKNYVPLPKPAFKKHWASYLTHFNYEIGIGYIFLYKNQVPSELSDDSNTHANRVLSYNAPPTLSNYFSVGYELNKQYSINFSATRNFFFKKDFKSFDWYVARKGRLKNIGKPIFIDIGLGYSSLHYNPYINNQNDVNISSIQLQKQSLLVHAQLSRALNRHFYLTLSGQLNYIIDKKLSVEYINDEPETTLSPIFATDGFTSALQPQVKLGLKYYLNPKI